jgi:hypothetical protein
MDMVLKAPFVLGFGAGALAAGLPAAFYVAMGCLAYGPIGWLLLPFLAGLAGWLAAMAGGLVGAVVVPVALIAGLGWGLYHAIAISL